MCSAPAWSMASALSMVDTSQRAGISCVGRGNESVWEGCEANIPAWRIAWLAPQSISSGGRSAVSKMSFSPVRPASISAG
ncbi:Uncharacterised protein [Salmonella enterica subsp. arizonae]|uniref:Uncharacterized protein n=1 Tax=Salmonella enterica subsp. arizonae TaxID=59203 RepID=A0A379S234_SALER|nr:Uncharacterised protein [Salmonella enterica subsp. arizonae]